MTIPRFRLRVRHLIGLVAAIAAFLAVMQYRRGVYDPVQALARRLHSYWPGERLRAITELERLGVGSRPAIPDLLGALNDGEPRVRARAARLLGMLLMGKDDDPRAGDVRAALAASLRDPDPKPRHAAAAALAWLRPDSRVVVPALVEAVERGDVEDRGSSLTGLGQFAEDPTAQSAILAAIGDPDRTVRYHAIGALTWRPAPDRLPAIRAAVAPALKDGDAIVRAKAVEILCRNGLGSSPDAPELVAALADPDGEVRTRAAVFLPYRPGSRAIVPALMRATADPETRVRLGAIQRIRRIGLDAEEALSALRRAAGDREDQVRREAESAIRSIESKAKDFRDRTLPDALADLGHADPEVRRVAAEALGDFGPRSAPAVPALARALGDRDAPVRATAARALGRIGPAARDALPALADRATDADESVRRAAQVAASAIGDGP